MPTTMEGLTQLGSDLRDLMANLLGFRTEMQALKDSTANNATTIIQSFVNRPQEQSWWIHEAAGVDGPGRGTLAQPFKTFDYCYSQMDRSVTQVVYLLSDVTISKVYNFSANVSFFGAVPGAGPLGLNFNAARRSLKFAAEAANSPFVSLGRCPAALVLQGTHNALLYVDPVLPNIAYAADSPYVMYFRSGELVLSSSTLSAETAATPARLIFVFDGARMVTSVVNFALGQNAAGKMFTGVGAGINPNSVGFQYETNITSA